MVDAIAVVAMKVVMCWLGPTLIAVAHAAKAVTKATMAKIAASAMVFEVILVSLVLEKMRGD